LAIIPLAHNDEPLQTSLKTSPEVGKITSLKTSPKEINLVKKYCEVGKITSTEKTSPKETTLVKKYCEVGKITSTEKTSPKETTL
jgi:hypothetical protein